MNKKNLPLIIVHIALMLGSLVFYLTFNASGAMGIKSFIEIFLITVTYISGILYLVTGFKKQSAVFYKMFMFAMLAHSVFSIAMIVIENGSFSFSMMVEVIAVIMILLLAFGKDLGRTKAILFAIIFLICRLIPMVTAIVQSRDLATISRTIAGFLIAGTTAIMVTEKYMDKINRGTD